MRLKLKFTQIFFCFLMAFCAKAQEVQGNLTSFSEIKTFNGIEVQFIPSEDNSIEISGHSKEDVKYEVVGNRLEIRMSLDNIWSKDNTRITVYGNSVETIDANEGSLVEVNKVLDASELTFRVQEGAQISALVKSRKIYSKAVTGGRITLKGETIEQEVDLNTGGHFYGRDLRTKETLISSGTAGRGEVFATQYVKATAKLGGTIEIFGSPNEVDHKTSLGGKIL